MGELKLLDPRSIRRRQEVEVDLGDGTKVIARRQDLSQMILDGQLPLPLLTAVQKMVEMPSATTEERVSALTTESGRTLIEMLRDHVVRVTLKPKLTLTETDDLDTLPVAYLSIDQLMMIWNATAIVPRVDTAEAAEFRGEPSASVADVPPPEHRVPPPPEQLDRVIKFASLPKETQHVESESVEFISG